MEYISNNTFGTLDSAPNGKIISKVFDFFTSVLHDFGGKENDNENHLTNELCKQLGFKKPPEFPFFFQHQNIEDAKENTSTDFAAFGTYTYAQAYNKEGEECTLVKFEAKRLSSTLPKKREREYVIGEYDKGKLTRNSGGIERFKNLRHGKDVVHAAIIGYVQTDSFEHWEKKINGWIKEEINRPCDTTLIWDGDDYLDPNWNNGKICSYLSKPKRKRIEQLNMHHIWVSLI
ncbi:hypothetical protein [Zunongwangia pacifica]|uniref:Uncharacterized protein n=1 Tax=Zunongwangia pacifica TaxID=2911062 RepID=A0A9X1ZYZ8_9FLAO|nr:hypothetical protein [Zunongwangia pacifica]MCL6218996.1 hypothetical protein [Zunongwangia pacifica]